MALEKYEQKRDFSKTPEPRGKARESRGGDGYLIQKHAATRLHYDLRLELDGVLKSWAVTRGPSLVPGEKRLAVHTEDHPLDYGDFEGTIPKGEYGGGTVILWDRGRWKPIGDPHRGYRKGHLEFEILGEKLGGRWHLVRMAHKPREKKENWLLIKGEDEHAREEGASEITDERPESVKTGRTVEEVADEPPGWSSRTGRIERPEPRAPRRAPRKAAAKEPGAAAASGADAAASPKKTAAKASKKKAAEAGASTRGVGAPATAAGAGAPPASLTRSPARSAAAIALPKKAKKAGWPGFIDPALATLKPAAPSGGKWLHEIKFDGYRLQAHIRKGSAKLLTRSGLDWTDRFGRDLPAALAALPVEQAILDGELIVEGAGGASDFSALQADLGAGRTDRLVFCAFDLLHLDAHDLRPAPQIARKQALAVLLKEAPPILRYSDHFEEDGELVLRHACRLSLEGVISKDRDAPYRSGRGRGWIKSKCSQRQEFVVAGFVPSTVSGKAVGSLVLGYHAGGVLVHAGRVGTGFTRKLAEDLFRRLQPLRRDRHPFGERPSANDARGVVWVAPKLVAEVEFRAWTAEGYVRHASFRGLREDRAAETVVRESQASAPAEKPRPDVRLTHPDRLYWKDVGVTKGGLADYYVEVWGRMAPFVVNRPLALVRCPDGVGGQCFFQKHVWRGMSAEILRAQDPKDKADDPIIGIDGLPGLLGLVQGGVLEIHPWGSQLGDLERPDFINMDLDPGPDVSWPQVIEAAQEVRQRLRDAGLDSFVKTSGGKGLHVVAPLKPRAGWVEVKAFAKGIADVMAADDPARYVATVSKARRQGRTLIDYLRNGRGSTAVAPYSTRARPGAAVSMPLDWSELSPGVGPDYFTVENAPSRLAAVADPWSDFWKAAKPLGTKGRNAA